MGDASERTFWRASWEMEEVLGGVGDARAVLKARSVGMRDRILKVDCDETEL
jgi:hypothetical protein